VLVILPEEQPDKSSLRSFLQQFNYYAAKKFISIIMRKELGDDLIKGINALFIQYSDDDINNFYLPKKSLCKKLKTNTYDLVVDLNLKFSLTSAVLCKESNAPVRVCLSKERGNEFFNFLLNPKDPTNNNATYSFLMNCLLMF
jgi:hypothetical protein